MRHCGVVWLGLWLACRGLAAEPVESALPMPLSPPERTELVRSNVEAPDTLDPARMRSGFAAETILSDLFEGLVGSGPHGEPVPAQAERWEMSDDGLVWRFFLRPGLTWSDGSSLKASDFVYAWRRLIDPLVASPSASLVLTAGINNATSIYGGALEVNNLGVEAEGDRIVRITLEHPVPHLLSIISLAPFAPVPADRVQKQGGEWARPGKLIGNGAFQLQEWTPQGEITLLRNPHYWGKTRLERVTYMTGLSTAREYRLYHEGRLQLTERVPASLLHSLREEQPPRLWHGAQLGTYLYTFNLSRPEVADVRVRRALSLALDREVLTQNVTGQGEPIAWSMLPDLTDYDSPLPAAAAWSRDVRLAKARNLLAAAGFSPDHPLRLSITFHRSETHHKLADAIAGMWAALGVEARVKELEWDAYEAAKSSGEFVIARSSLFGDYADPYAMLGQFRCRDPQNESGYCDEQFDALLVQAQNTLDVRQRARLYQQAEMILNEAVPAIPLYYYTQARLVDPTLRGLPLDGIHTVLPSRDLYFSQE